MTVHFIGAGPGAADLITLRGRDLIARCPVCLYAGSIIPRALLAHCPPGARIIDGKFTAVQQAVGTSPKNKAAAAYLRGFVEEAKSSGLVAKLIARHNVRGLSVAPKVSHQLR